MARNRRRPRPVEPLHERHVVDAPFNAQVAPAIVDDPYSTIGEKIVVTRSIRNDPLAGLFSRQSIDHAQFAAGRKWQQYYETAGIGSVIAMNPMKEPVDGQGATRADFTDMQLEAFGELKNARSALGPKGNAIVVKVLGEGMAINDLAKRWGSHTQFHMKYFGRRFRECLETLAELWGFAGRVHKQSTKPRRMGTA